MELLVDSEDVVMAELKSSMIPCGYRWVIPLSRLFFTETSSSLCHLFSDPVVCIDIDMELHEPTLHITESVSVIRTNELSYGILKAASCQSTIIILPLKFAKFYPKILRACRSFFEEMIFYGPEIPKAQSDRIIRTILK